MIIIDGKACRDKMSEDFIKEIIYLKSKGISPRISILQVEGNNASDVYVRNKLKFCEKVGARGELIKLPANSSNDEVKEAILKLNNDKDVNGILLQLPLPQNLNEEYLTNLISEDKDVDCFHVSNVGKLWTAKKTAPLILPCTPAGCIELLKQNNIKISQTNVVVIGRSNIVGKPIAALFLLEDATVTVCHSKTLNLKEVCKKADILICAIGKAKFINSEYTNQNQTIIDVGMNVDENNKLCGDVDYNDVKDKVFAITPVPGGVGPMTISILMKNLISVTKHQNEITN